MPFIASLSDIFGRAPVLLASLACFTLGTILCCVAENLATLIAGRCVQGIGGGGLIILGLVIFTDIVPLRFRSKYYGIIQGAWAIGTCIGPIVGGAFVANTTWRWIFYIMFPFAGIAFITIPFVLTLKPRTESLLTKLGRVDWFGGFLFISSSTSLLIAISWGGSQYAWDSFRTLVPLILGALGLVATCVWEAKFAKEPFFGRHIFHCRDAFAAYIGTTAQGFLVSKASCHFLTDHADIIFRSSMVFYTMASSTSQQCKAMVQFELAFRLCLQPSLSSLRLSS